MHLYRRPKSKFWWCAYRLPSPTGAVLVRKSTGKQLKRDAETAAADLREADLREAGAGEEKARVSLRLLSEAQEKSARGELTVVAARALLLQMARDAGSEVRVWTVREWVEEWMAARLPVVSKATAAAYRTHKEKFLAFLGERAEVRLEMVEAGEIRRFRDHVRKGRAAKSANLAVKVIRSCFQAAVREGVLVTNPAAPVEFLPETDSSTRQPFSWAEVEDILRACPDDEWRAVTLLGVLAGLRLADAASLRWRNVDLAAGTLTLIPRKKLRKGKPVTIPLHPKLRGAITALPRALHDESPLCPALAAMAVPGRSGLSLRFKRIVEAAAKSAKWKGGTGRRTFHSTRHSFVSLLANAGVSEELRRKLSDHDTAAAHATYTHTQLATLRAAVEQIALPGA